jgi:hypothetical protein
MRLIKTVHNEKCVDADDPGTSDFAFGNVAGYRFSLLTSFIHTAALARCQG